jgi:hypothetical protein
VELAIDCFFVNRHVFFTTFSTKVCFTTVTHLTDRTKEAIWAALLATYKMYLLRGFRVVVIKGDQVFAAISDLAVALPTTPSLLGGSIATLWTGGAKHSFSQGENSFHPPQSTL